MSCTCDHCDCDALDAIEEQRQIELTEEISSVIHDIWGEWMKYLFSRCEYDEEEKKMVIPRWAIDRWQRQICTKYENLSEEEKESDRIQARKILNLL